MQGASLGVCELVTFVVCDEIENGALGQGGRFVDTEPPILDTRSNRTHGSTLLMRRPTCCAFEAWPTRR